MSLPPWQYWFTLGLALMLSIAHPFPGFAAWNPDWVPLVVIYWVLHYPRRSGVGSAWFAGLLLDVMQGALLGANALALTLVGYLTRKLYLRLRVFPLPQQSLSVALLLTLYHFVLFWVDGIVDLPAEGLARWTPILLSVVVWVPMQAAFRIFWPRISKN